jgi:hypothetical protein
MSRLVRALCVALLAAGVCAFGLPAAAADDGGLLRLAHLSPDTPPVDVYVTPVGDRAATVVLRGVSYGTISAYRRVPPGAYTVAVRAPGAAASTPPALATTVRVGSLSARTVAAVSSFATLRLDVLSDDLAPPPPGDGRLRVISAAAAAKSLDVFLAGGAPLAAKLPFASTGGYVDVAAGAAMLEVGPTGAARTAQPVRLAAGSVYSVVVLDKADGGLVVRTVLDAAGPGVTPAGGVETGAGGAAPAVGDGTTATQVAAVGLAALATVALVATRRSRLALALVAVSAGAVAVGPSTASQPVSVPAAYQIRAAASTQSPVLGTVLPAARVVPPSRVRIPALGIDSTLARLGTDPAGALVPPADFARAGWFTGGPPPGATGPAVIAGHVDSVRGPAVFFRLAQLHSGDDVLITRTDGTSLRFTVTSVARYPKSSFPTAEVYGPTAEPQLRLITCGGAFDRSRRSYVDDVVVFARLA